MAYTWQTPYEWLEDYVKRVDENVLAAIVLELAKKVDPDDIEDIFAEEMDDDRYWVDWSKGLSDDEMEDDDLRSLWEV